MFKIFNIIGKVICYLLIAAGTIFGILIIVNSAKMATSVELQQSLLMPVMYITFAAAAICLLVSVVLPLFFATYTKKKLIKIALVVVIIAVLVVISMLIPDSQLSPEFLEQYNVSEVVARRVGVGCYLTYITCAIAIITIIYSAINNMIKNK